MHCRPFAFTVLLAASAVARTGAAQQLDLPRPSPNAKASAVIGVTEISVEYSSPGVKGRPVWGTVVPYDQLWRTGANAATRITFSKDVTIDGKPVPAGSYSLFTIPGKGDWTVILNKNPTAAVREYKQDQDLLRFTTRPTEIAPRERLAFVLADFDENGGRIDMEWEKVRLGIPFKLGTDAQVAAGIAALEGNGWRPWNNAARYEMETKKDNAQAMKLVDKSIALKEDWYNLWTKAQLLKARAGKDDKKAALSLLDKVKALGDKDTNFFIKDDVAKALVDWKK